MYNPKTKRCPECMEMAHDEFKRCPHCRYWFVYHEERAKMMPLVRIALGGLEILFILTIIMAF